MLKYFSSLPFLICLLFPAAAHCEVKMVDTAERGEVSKITFHLDKIRTYSLVKKSGRSVEIVIDDKFSNVKLKIPGKSGLIKSFEPIKGRGESVSFKITFNRNISNISAFSLKSPPRIVINTGLGGGENPPDEEYRKPVSIVNSTFQPDRYRAAEVKERKEKTAKNRPQKNPKASENKSTNKKNSYEFEGLEDVVLPSLDPFIEIFGTDEAISIYHIKLPPEDKLPDYPARPRMVGDYDLNNRDLINAARNIGDGDFDRALELLDNAGDEVKKTENYAFLRADALFQKAIFEGNVDEAMNFYNEMILNYPQPRHVPWAYMQVGRGNLQLGLYRRAAKAFKRVVDNFRNSPYAEHARLLLAKALSKQNQKEAALRAYKKFIEELPASPFLAEAVFGAAENMTYKGRYRRSAALFDKGLQRWPQFALTDPDILMTIGDSNYFMKRFDEALKYYIRLVNLYPDNMLSSNAMARLGDIYIHRKKLETAKKIFEEIELKYPGSDGALIGRIRIAEHLAEGNAKTGEIVSYYEGVYNKYPKSPLAPIATLKAGLFLTERKEWEEAFRLYLDFERFYSKNQLNSKVSEEILKVFPMLLQENNEKDNCIEILRLSKRHNKLMQEIEKSSPNLIVGNCFSRYGQYDDALSHYKEITEGNELEEALLMTGRALYLGGDIDLSIASMEKFMALFPDAKGRSEMSYLLAEAYEKKGEPAKSIKLYRLFLKTPHSNDIRADVNIRLADLLKKTGDIDGAVKAYSLSARLYSKENSIKRSRAYFLLGEVLYKREEFNAALDAYRQAIANAAEKIYEEAQYKAALCYYKSGDIEKARETLKGLSQVDGDPFWKSLSDKTVKDVISRVPL